MEDAFLGAALAIPARNSPFFDWSNYDITFFAGIDEINTPAFLRDDSAANVYGVNWFLEALDGFFEIGYAYLDDRQAQDRSYHNVGFAFTRRWHDQFSFSVRYIANLGQDRVVEQTADGHLVLFESSLITSDPSRFVPYLNLFAGFDRPQSVARAGVAGGILRNTGITFETDGLTGFPLLDDSAQNTYGGALGIELLGQNFDYQIVVELATVLTMGSAADRRAPGNQYGLGLRYQVPLNHAWLLRADGLHGLLEDAHDVTGARVELRHKF